MICAYIDPGTGYTVASLFGLLIAFGVGFLGVLAAFYKKIFKFFRNRKKLLFIVVAVVAAAGIFFAVGVLMGRKESDFDRKIVILGFDGLSPEILEPMMEAGELPHFSALKESGSYSRLATTNPSQSPVAWTGFSTGQNPGKHGVYDFIVRDPKKMDLKLSLSNISGGRAHRVIKTRCFWNYTSDKRIPTTILSCPVTFPPDKVYGRMISGMGVPDILGTEGTFTFYTTEKIENTKDIGGTVVQVRNEPLIVTKLIGPKKRSLGGTVENVTVPMQIERGDDGRVSLGFQNASLSLTKNSWSSWSSVTFDLGQRRRMRGILKFYLVETNPELKLYASPINFDPREPFFPLAYPSEYSTEMATEIGLYYTQGMPMDTWAVNEGRIPEKALVEQMNEIIREKKAMLDLELDRFEKGVLYCYFESSDIVQHMFWRYLDPQHPLYEENAPAEYRSIIHDWYRKMDAILGEVMAYEDEADYLFVLSDHGFDTFRRAVHLNTWLRQNGYLELKDPYGTNGAELLKDVDWEKTRAYSIGFGAIYINQQGREKNGIVEKGEETEKLKREISEKLTQWFDEKYQQPVINKVHDGNDLFFGKHAENTPDLYVGFNIGYRASWQSALGAVPEKMIEDNLKKWSGSHLFDPVLIPGVLFCSEQITKRNPSLYDLTPTILKIVGFDDKRLKECDFDGLPLF